MVEFALIAPVLVMLLFGLVEFAVAYDRQQALTGAAREGARSASIGETVAEINTRVTDATQGTTFDSAITTTVYLEGTQITSGTPCTGFNQGFHVEVDLSVDEIVEIPFVTSRTIQLTATGSFLCE